MVNKQEIILRYFREGDSIRKICRDLGLHRDTVRRYLEEYREAKAASEKNGDKSLLHHTLTEGPKYTLKEARPRTQTRSLGYEDFLLEILQEECSAREENRKKEHIRSAGFPQYKYLYDLSKEDLPLEASQKLAVLESLDFIQTGQNVILAGNSGTGKTHIATGLGIKACQKGYKVLFTTVSRLLTQLRESRAERTLRMVESRFEKYDLVICDEFGYISFDKEGAELLFSHLSLRTGRKSTIITTNLSFERWSEIFEYS